MSKSAEVFNLMDNLLPRAEDVELAGPDELQRLYAGIGMPSLRAMELSGQAGVTYHEIKAANPLLGLVDPIRIRNRYVELREQALIGDENALNDLGWWWLNGLRLKPNPALAKRLLRIAAVMGSAGVIQPRRAGLLRQGVDGQSGLSRRLLRAGFRSRDSLCCASIRGLYERGDEGVIVDHGKAISWYKRGAAEQDLMACFSLGRLALDETSPEYDPALGLYWLQSAAMRGLVLATERLAEFYFSTFESPPDPDGLLFRFWRDLAISQGSLWARELRASDVAIQQVCKSS